MARPGSLPANLTAALPSTFPSGVDPATYEIREVTRLLRRAAYFSLFSVHDPSIPNTPILAPGGGPDALVGIKVNENTHRFDIRVQGPTAQGLEARNLVGEVAAHVQIEWRVVPQDFAATPDLTPPPTILDPRGSQRFVMLNGSFSFLDRNGSGMKGFGAGRTFPAVVAGNGQLWIGAAIDMLEGVGSLAGMQGCAVVNGFISPPQDLFINVMLRVMDPDGRLLTDAGLTPMQTQPNPDPNDVFMTFLGEPDPDKPVTLNFGPDGSLVGSTVHELLRLVHIDFDLGRRGRGVRSKSESGRVAATLSTNLMFNPLDPATPGTSTTPIPYWTDSGTFTFYDRSGAQIGSIEADIVEGRGFRTELRGAPMPVFRLVGFGPFERSTGQLAGAAGMVSMNGVVSVFPRTLSNLYIFRFSDPTGRYRAALA